LIYKINKLLLLHLVGSSVLLYLHWWCTFKHKSNFLFRGHRRLFLPYSGWSLKVTTHLAPVLRLGISGAIHLLPIPIHGTVLSSNTTNL